MGDPQYENCEFSVFHHEGETVAMWRLGLERWVNV